MNDASKDAREIIAFYRDAGVDVLVGVQAIDRFADEVVAPSRPVAERSPSPTLPHKGGESISAPAVAPASPEAAVMAAPIMAYRPKKHRGRAVRLALTPPATLRAKRIAVCIGTDRATPSAQSTSSTERTSTAASVQRTSWPEATRAAVTDATERG